MATRLGLTVLELRKGVRMQSELEKLCPHFSRMHALFGAPHNMNPPTLIIVGMHAMTGRDAGSANSLLSVGHGG